MSSSLSVPPLWAELAGCDRVLIAGAGGGFDVYAGLPIAHRLAAGGASVTLANLSFSDLSDLPDDAWSGDGVARIRSDSPGNRDYFPERTLVRWLESEGLAWEVYAIVRAGVEPVSRAYAWLVERCRPDALVLVDGGTDILLRGDEAGLGTPEEDVVSLLAAGQAPVPTKLVVSLGFGIDAHHGVAGTDTLRRLAEVAREGAYLGALSIPGDSPEALAYCDAVSHAALHNPARPSIVNGQIAAAVQGEFGHPRIAGDPPATDLFVNPLMAVYFTVRLDVLASALLYRDRILNSQTIEDVSRCIEDFRAGLPGRAARPFPH